jgi:hypothetical protein
MPAYRRPTKEKAMPNFLYIFRGGGMSAKLSPQELQQQMQKWGAWIQQLRQDGHFKAGEPLENGGKVVRGKKKAVTDGPYAEAKDLVGGFLLVEARSLEEATELSRGCPGLDVDGTVEIRPIASMNM